MKNNDRPKQKIELKFVFYETRVQINSFSPERVFHKFLNFALYKQLSNITMTILTNITSYFIVSIYRPLAKLNNDRP